MRIISPLKATEEKDIDAARQVKRIFNSQKVTLIGFCALAGIPDKNLIISFRRGITFIDKSLLLLLTNAFKQLHADGSSVDCRRYVCINEYRAILKFIF